MFTIDELEQAIRNLANEHPEFVYETTADDKLNCFYTRGGDPEKPGCIVGRACLNLDVSLLPNLRIFDENSDSYDSGVEELFQTLNIPVDPIRLKWFEKIQIAQDSGETWQTAVNWADEFLLGER
jgi:hypothetical protein